jgi:hypothetical protein
MPYPLRQLAIALFFSAFLPSLHAAPGASVPWTTYEAEDMTNNGGMLIGPPAQLANISVAVPNLVEMEASGGKAVKLTGTGQYVELTAQAAANAIVVRYCVPDSADGVGIDSTISLYQNGSFVQKLPVTSKYSWRYGNYNSGTPAFSNTPGDGKPRNFFDEVRQIGLTINPGDTIRIQKDADDTNAYCVVDLVDLENVADQLSAPANSLNITNYGAVGDGVTDCTTALQNCVNAASSQLKPAWIPAGTWLVTGTINLPANTTLQGAGMWYTTLLGSASLYNTTPSRRINFNGAGGKIHLSDFAILGKLNYRYDTEPNDGLGGGYGTQSTISRIWVEHTKTGAWIVNSSGLVVSDCRFRDTEADGINLQTGVRGSIVTNCTARGTGDDCFAIWPAGVGSYVPGFNLITHCTGQAPFLANGGAIYGAPGNRIEDCTFVDMPYGAGLLISGTFAVGTNLFAGLTVAQRCNLTRCGGYDPNGWNWRAAVTIVPHSLNITNLNLNHLNISNSLSYGLEVIYSNPGTLSNATMNVINVSNYGVGVNGVYGVWAGLWNTKTIIGNLNVGGLTVNGTPIPTMPASGTAVVDQSGPFAFNFLPAPSLTWTISGNLLQLAWPINYLGWSLQSQTNDPAVGLGSNWNLLSDTSGTNQFSTVLTNSGTGMFFRLINL